MANKDIKTTVRRLFNVINNRDLSRLGEFVADDFTYRATSGEEADGIDEMREFITEYYDAFSDFELSLEDVFVEGNRAAILYRQTGRLTGKLFGVEPNDNQMDVLVSEFATFNDENKVTDVFDIFDTLEILRQLGAVPREFEQKISAGQTGGQTRR